MTEQKSTEQELRETLRQLEAQKRAVDQFAIVAETDPRGIITYANDQFCRVSKYRREELIGKDHRDVVNSGHHSKEFWHEMWATINLGEVWRGDIRNHAKDGTIYWVDTTIVPFLGPDGKPEKYLAVRAVITERKQAEEDLRNAYNEMEQRVQERTNEIQNMNLASLNLLEDSHAEGKKFELVQRATTNVLEDFDEEREKFQLIQKATLNLLEDVNVERDRFADIQRAQMNILEDIEAERTKAEQARTLLETANEELKAFSYSVSHDLKAPLRGIDSLAGWIAEDFRNKLDEEGKKNLGMLQTRVKKMHALIDGILEYSRIGRIREEIETVDLNQLLPGIIEFLSPPTHIQIEVQKKLPVVKAEKTRIHQVFQNLLSNAIKYAGRPQGKIKVGCETGAGFWRFSVSDNGPGIEEKYHERIFELFQTLDSTETSEHTGVGLSLVKKIVEFYGGRAGVKSKPGQGSTFWFTLPKSYETQRGENR